MDWNKLEELTDSKILYASLAGSRRYGLERESSDTDYEVYVKFNENAPIYNIVRTHHFSKAGAGDIFVKNIDSTDDINFWGGIQAVPSYGSIVYAHESVFEFLTNNQHELMNLSPLHTYENGKSSIQYYLNPARHRKKLALVVRHAAVLHNFMQTGDFTTSMYCDGKFLELYNKAINYDSTITPEYLHQHIDFLFDDKTKLFFEQFTINNELHQELLNQLRK